MVVNESGRGRATSTKKEQLPQVLGLWWWLLPVVGLPWWLGALIALTDRRRRGSCSRRGARSPSGRHREADQSPAAGSLTAATTDSMTGSGIFHLTLMLQQRPDPKIGYLGASRQRQGV
jgi:hypothetical protein